jgi:hypothetical protein
MQITEMKPTTALDAKMIQSLLENITYRTAQYYLTDIKKQYNTKCVLYCHFKNYFNII